MEAKVRRKQISGLLFIILLTCFALAPARPACGQTGQSGTASQGQAGGTSGQATSPASRAPGGVIGGSPSTGATDSILGGGQLPGAAVVTQGPTALSLEQAIEIAIRNNSATLLAAERRREARGQARQARAGLLPNISGAAYQASMTENLAALGFRPGTIPGFGTTFVGPFNNFDARVQVTQAIFDLSAIRNSQAGRAGVRVAELQEESAREQVAVAAALTYLEVLRSDRAVRAARADMELSETLLKLAQDQRNIGVATGLDVVRAETRLAGERVQLAQAQTAADQAVLNLQRVVGLPIGGALSLTDPLRFAVEPQPSAESAVEVALQRRPEVRLAEAQLRAAGYERRAVRAELFPSLVFVGDYGVSGMTPTNTALPTRRVAVQLNVPVFDGGLKRGRIEVAASRQRQAELELGNIRGQVEEDVRLALSTLRTTTEQVKAAEQSVVLALRELEMARDRFRAGVGDNIEVVTAQAALSDARNAQVAALAQYNTARLNLAAALGRAQSFRW